MISRRVKTMLDMVAAENSTSSPVLTTNIEKKKIESDQGLKERINKLHSRPYSMTTPVFEKFCETQNSLTSYHFHDLPKHLNKLNEAFPAKECSKESTTGDLEAPGSDNLCGHIELSRKNADRKSVTSRRSTS